MVALIGTLNEADNCNLVRAEGGVLPIFPIPINALGVISVSGAAPITSTGGPTPVIGITAATEIAAGSLSAADKTKLDGIAPGASIVAIGVTAPLTSSGGTSPTLGISAATEGAAGSMSAADKTKLDSLGSAMSIATSAALTALVMTPYVVGALFYLQSRTTLWSYQPTDPGPADGNHIAAAGGGFFVYVAAGRPSTAATQAAWQIDPVAGNDENTGLTAPAAIQTFAEVVRRMGTNRPALAQVTTFTWLNPAPASDVMVFFVTLIGGGGLRMVGTPVQTAAGTIGVFTAPNFATGARGNITASGAPAGFWTPLVGQSVHDTTTGTTFVVEADLGAATAQISTSLAFPLPLGGSAGVYTAPVNGDAFVVNQYPKIFVNQLEVYNLGTAAGSGADVRFLEMGGELESLYNTQVTFADCRLTAALMGSRKAFDSQSGPICQSCFISGGLQGQWTLYGGASTGNNFFMDQSRLDGDVWMKNAIPWQGVLNVPRACFQATPTIGFMRPGNSLAIITSSFGAPSRLWGAGGLNLSHGASLELLGGTAVATLLLAGAIQLDGVATGFAFVTATGIFTAPAIATTPANIDASTGLKNPRTGSAFIF